MKKKDKTKSPPLPNKPFLVVGVGASAGGLEAFTLLLKHLPADTGFAFVLVQHLDPVHESVLTELLARASSMPVLEVTNNLRVEPNHVYVIPPNMNMAIAKGVLKLSARQQTAGEYRSIDFFLKSLAEDQRDRAIGVILSGTASDGTLGLKAIKAEGGITFAQDGSAKYDSMPRNAQASGCVDNVLSPEDIAKELARIAGLPRATNSSEQPSPALPSEGERKSRQPRVADAAAAPGEKTGSLAGAGDERLEGEAAENGSRAETSALKKILLLLHAHCGVDFSLYKSNTIERRVSRRMVLSKHNTLGDYAAFLKGNARELDTLYSDVLINVTSFFRNPEAFETLKRRVFPKLLAQPSRHEKPLRVWVPGCSAGQEAYSIAMAFLEASAQTARAPKLQVFATDLNKALLDKARRGLYAKSLVADVPPARLRRFFVEEEGGYRVGKALREMVVFARQNLIADPPFSRMDLISCRNLLIYLEPGLQKQVVSTFHYALKPEGYLFLGASESVGSFTNLFEPVDNKHKMFSKIPGPTPAYNLPVAAGRVAGRNKPPAIQPGPLPEGFRTELNAQQEADRVTVNRFAPPGVLVNGGLEILQFRGATSPYLEPPTGKASFGLLGMAREGLLLPLRATINQAKRENKPSRRDNARVQQNGCARMVTIEVIPLRNLKERCYLILFEEKTERAALVAPSLEPAGGARKMREPVSKQTESRRITELERELSETRDYLQSIRQQHEAANEVLQASSEETQSANEELETSKEELESTNEELTTVNDELANRNTELNRLNGDLNNLQIITHTAVLLLGRDMAIRRFTPLAEKTFNLVATDVGRPLSKIKHNLDLPDLERFVTEVIDTVSVREREVRDKEGRWYSLRARPYMTLDNQIDGAVLALVDIDALKRSKQEMNAAREYAEATLRTARQPLIVLRLDFLVNTANEAFYRTFKVTPGETEGRSIFELSNGQWNIPKLRLLLEDILPRNSFFNDFEVTHDFPGAGSRTMLLNARRLDSGAGTPQMVLLAFEDVTERHRASEATTKLAAIVEATDDAVFSNTLEGVITSWNAGAERMCGYSAEAIVGKNFSVLSPSEGADDWERIQEKLRRDRRVTQFETEWVRKDRSHIQVTLSISALHDRTGALSGASVIARDVTERKRTEKALRDSEERLRRALTKP